MAVNRANAVINQQIELGMAFFKNNQLFDPFEISKVEIYDTPALTTIVQTIVPPNITQISLGKYSVVTAPFAISDTYFDVWTFKSESGATDLTETSSVQVLDVSAGADAQMTALISDVRLDIADDGANPKYSDAQLIGFAKKAADKLKGCFNINVSSGTITPALTPTQFGLLVMQVECLIARRELADAAGKGLKATLGPTSIDTTAKFSGLIAVAGGSGGVCTQLEKCIRNYKLNGDPDDPNAGGGANGRSVVL